MRITQYATVLDKESRHSVLIKEQAFNYPVTEFNTAESISHLLCDVFHLDIKTEEYVYLLCFNTRQRVQGVFELSHGTVNCSFCNPREIFQKALLCNASSVILAHNHPSGDCTPSQDDMQTYQKVKQAGELIGITVLDNLIITTDGYYSFNEHT